jgi:pilus assembly protein CpaF
MGNTQAPHIVTERIRARLKARLTELLRGTATNGLSPSRQLHALRDQLRQTLRSFPQDDYRALCISRIGEEDRFLDEIITETMGLGPLDELLSDVSISEIMVNGPNEVFVERQGRLERVGVQFRDTTHLMATIERMLDTMGLSVNESSPMCDASLPDGSRINVIIPPLALNGPVITIRRKLPQWAMTKYVATGAMDEQAAQFLEACVRAKVNMVFSGGTSTGKTTLVAILSTVIPAQERVITIENVPELELPEREHWIRLVSKASNLEGRGEIPMRSLVKNALRMRPDRIILGEARGGEALDVVQAMHSGHDGFITVVHANSPQAALERLETLMLMSGVDLPSYACRMQIASAVELIVHLGRFAQGERQVVSIAQVRGVTASGFELEELFIYEPGEGPSDRGPRPLRFAGVPLVFAKKFQMHHVPLPECVKGVTGDR